VFPVHSTVQPTTHHLQFKFNTTKTGTANRLEEHTTNASLIISITNFKLLWFPSRCVLRCQDAAVDSSMRIESLIQRSLLATAAVIRLNSEDRQAGTGAESKTIRELVARLLYFSNGWTRWWCWYSRMWTTLKAEKWNNAQIMGEEIVTIRTRASRFFPDFFHYFQEYLIIFIYNVLSVYIIPSIPSPISTKRLL
jgi:hypothetical protein